MKIDQSITLSGVKVSLSYEVLPQSSALFPGDGRDLESGSDTFAEDAEEVFLKTLPPGQTHELLLQAHSQFYQNLLVAAYGVSRERVASMNGNRADESKPAWEMSGAQEEDC